MPKRAVVKVSGAQKFSDPYVKVSGAWKTVLIGLVKVAGAWKEFYQAVINTLAGITYDNVSLSYSTDFTDVTCSFGDSGTKFYVSYVKFQGTPSDPSDDVHYVDQYNLSTAWDLSTATFQRTDQTDLANTYNLDENGTREIRFKPDGTRFFISWGASVDYMDLSVAWNISTGSHTFSNPDDAGNTIDSTYSFFIKPDGTKLYTSKFGFIYQDSIDTAWNTNALTYDNKSFDTSSFLAQVAEGMWFSSDGLFLYLLGRPVGFGPHQIFQCSLSTAWDISTAVYDGFSFEPAEPGTGVLRFLSFKDDFTKMYVLEPNDREIYQYSIPA